MTNLEPLICFTVSITMTK